MDGEEWWEIKIRSKKAHKEEILLRPQNITR